MKQARKAKLPKAPTVAGKQISVKGNQLGKL